MCENDIIKGISALKSIAKNLREVIEFCENNNISEMLPYIDEMNSCCSMLTDIFEKAFTNFIIEKGRLEDDGK